MASGLRNWAAEQAQIRQYRERRRRAATQISKWKDPKAVARRAKQLRRALPHVSPKVVLPLAERGLSLDNPTDRQILRSLSKTEAQARAAKGNFAKPGEETDGTFQSQAALAQARAKIEEHNRMSPTGFGDLPVTDESVRNLAENRQAGIGQLTGALDYLPVVAPVKAAIEGEDPATVLSRIAPGAKAFEDVREGGQAASDAVPFVGDQIRGVSRATFLALDTPMQLLNASFRTAASGDYRDFSDPLGVDQLEAQFRQTQGGQAAIDLAEGRRVDVGAGWFPALDSKTANRAAEESRAQSPYLIGGHAWTPGRFVANQVADPDSTEFDILSGAVDAAVTVKFDPLNLPMAAFTAAARERRIVKPDVLSDVGEARTTVRNARRGLAGASKVQRAARRDVDRLLADTADQPGLFASDDLASAQARLTAADETLASQRSLLDETTSQRDTLFDTAVEGAGGRRGPRLWVNRKTTTEWFASPQGSSVLDYHQAQAERLGSLADDIDNAADDTVRTSAQATYDAAHSEAVYDSWTRYGKKGPLEFHDNLVRARDRQGVMGVLDDSLGTTLREFPIERKFRPTWKPKLDGYRWASKAPNEPALWLDDPDDAAEQAERWLRNAQVPREQRAEVFGKIVRAQGEDDWYDAANRMTQIVEDRLVDVYKTPRSYARAATRIFGTTVDDDFRRFGIESMTGDNLDSPLAVVNEAGIVMPSPHLMVEQLATNIPLPAYKDIRTLTKGYGGFASRWATIAEKHESLARTARNAANDALRDSKPDEAARLADDAVRQARYAKAARGVESGKDVADMIVGASRVTMDGGNLDLATGWATKGMQVWRKARLFRPAWGVRVVGEEQARLWQYGLDGLFNHPVQALAIVLGANPESRLGRKLAALPSALVADADDNIVKALTKRVGRSFIDDIGAWQGDAKGVPFVFDDPDFAESLNKPFSDIFESATPRGVAQSANAAGDHRLWTTATRGDPRWNGAVVDEVIRLRNDPIARAVAQADNPEAAKQWLLGEGRKSFDQVFRPERVVRTAPDAAPKMVGELTPQELDRMAGWYVDTVYSRLHGVSAGNDMIFDAIRTGTLDGTNLTIGKGYDSLVDSVKRFADEGWEGPTHVRAPLPRGKGLTKSAGHFVDQVMWELMPRPSNYLSRSPAFRQLYWRRAEELAPFLDAADRIKMLANAKAAGVPASIRQRILGIPTSADSIGLNELDRLSKGYALQTTKDLLYDLSERGQMWDQLRLLFPFGEAYQEVLSRWAKGVAQNPKILRRLGQGVALARGSGVFEKGPFGQEVFTYGPAEWIGEKMMDLTGTEGVPVPISGSVSGLNIAGNGLPGVGPVVQIPLSYLKRNSPGFDKWLQTDEFGKNIYDFVFPYGDQFSGNIPNDIAELVLPTWVGRVLVGVGNPEGDKEFGNTVGYMMNYYASTGKYDLHGPDAVEESDRLLKDATKAAKFFMIFRGLSSATLPTAPIPRWALRDKNNKLVEQTVIRDKYYDRLTKDGGDAAFEWLIDTYGDAAFLVAQGMSTTTGFTPRTEKQWSWVAKNPKVRDLYPETYGLFAPEDPKGEFDFTGYQLTEGRERERLSPKQRLDLANHRLASYIYDKAAGRYGEDIDDETQDALDNLKMALEEEYPGYNTGAVDYASTKRRILELTRAVDDKELAKVRPGAVAGVRDYLTLRDKALEMQDERGLTSRQVSTAQDAADIRAWLKKYGRKIVEDHPQFRQLWQQVFMRELV